MPKLGEQQIGPLRTWLPKGNQGVFGVHAFNVVGSGILAAVNRPPTGSPTGVNSGGVPLVSATLVATGVYDVRFPAAQAVDILPSVAGPGSGFNFDAYVNKQSPSGSAQLEITRAPAAAGGASGLNPIQASGFRGFLPTGTKVMLAFYGSPVSDGLTSY